MRELVYSATASASAVTAASKLLKAINDNLVSAGFRRPDLAFAAVNLAHVRILLYFRLIRDVGPTSALTVAYLIPMFGVFWRVVFLGEPVTPALLSGTALVLLGTTLTTGFALGMLRQALSRLRIY